MAEPGLLMTLHRLADAYHTDPWSVLEWAPERVALAVAALDQADATRAERIRRQGEVQPVVDVGRL